MFLIKFHSFDRLIRKIISGKNRTIFELKKFHIKKLQGMMIGYETFVLFLVRYIHCFLLYFRLQNIRY